MEETPKQLKSVKEIVDEVVAIFEREGLMFFPPDNCYGHKCEADLIVDAVRAIRSYPSFATDADKNREELFKRSFKKEE